MDEWATIKLGEISEMCLGKMLDKVKNKGELHPYLSNIDVRWGSFDLSELREMRFEEREHERYGLKDGDLVVCEGGEPGRCAIWKGQVPNMKIQKALHRVRITKNHSNTFIYYRMLLAGRTGGLAKHFIGSTIKHLTGDRLREVEFAVPSLELQQKIAAVLSALDAKIEVNNRINAELERMAKTFYDYWFVQFDFPDENGNPYKSSGGKMVYNADLKRQIPYGWEIRTLDTLLEIKNGFAFKSQDYKNEGVPVVRTKNFLDGSIVLDDAVFLSKEDAEDYKGFQLKKFDLLIVMVGASVGNRATVPSYILPALQNQNMWNFRPLNSNVKIFSNLLIQTIIHEQLHIASGSARSFFQKEYFYSLKRELAPVEIASNFESVVKPLFERKDVIHSENKHLCTLRDWLLPMLMNGQVTVN